METYTFANCVTYYLANYPWLIPTVLSVAYIAFMLLDGLRCWWVHFVYDGKKDWDYKGSSLLGWVYEGPGCEDVALTTVFCLVVILPSSVAALYLFKYTPDFIITGLLVAAAIAFIARKVQRIVTKFESHVKDKSAHS